MRDRLKVGAEHLMARNVSHSYVLLRTECKDLSSRLFPSLPLILLLSSSRLRAILFYFRRHMVWYYRAHHELYLIAEILLYDSCSALTRSGTSERHYSIDKLRIYPHVF